MRYKIFAAIFAFIPVSLIYIGNLRHVPTLPITDHFNGEHFFNPSGKSHRKTFSDLWKWHFGEAATPWPESVADTVEHLRKLPDISNDDLQIVWINHATVLLRTKDVTVLTDPVFSERVSPISWIGPKRVRPPLLTLDSLPRINIVVISHNHYDHMDIPSLTKICERDQPLLIIPLANKRWVDGTGCSQIAELDWWQETNLGNACKIIATPAQHWSGRKVVDYNTALWAGYFIQLGQRSVFFAGDTGYGAHFTEIRQRLGKPEIALMPIGAYSPRWFMKDNHMNPQDAVQAHIDIGAQQSIPIHFGTFKLSNEGLTDPIADLAAARKVLQISDKNFMPLEGSKIFTLCREKAC